MYMAYICGSYTMCNGPHIIRMISFDIPMCIWNQFLPVCCPMIMPINMKTIIRIYDYENLFGLMKISNWISCVPTGGEKMDRDRALRLVDVRIKPKGGRREASTTTNLRKIWIPFCNIYNAATNNSTTIRQWSQHNFTKTLNDL